jgi:glutaminyl-peptide cyclotransferase
VSSTLGIRPRITLLLAHLVCFALLRASLLSQSRPHASNPTPEYSYKVIYIFPHDATAFTQGLTYKNGFLYEGTGINGHSSIRKVRLETGEVIEKRDLPAEFFGEGIAVFNEEVVQLTWLSHKGFVYNLKDFAPEGTFSYSGEGWGLAIDGRVLFMSDGTSTIRVLNPRTFQEQRHLNVSDHGQPVTQLNELEFVEGTLC